MMRKDIRRHSWRRKRDAERPSRVSALALSLPGVTASAQAKPEAAIVCYMRERGLTLSLAESCTGGMVAACVVNVPGASDVFVEGFVTYTDKAKKRRLGVKKKTLRKYTAVSARTAAEMAEGGCLASGSDVCISVTGYAGPGGGTSEHPVGTVYIGCCMSGRTVVRECHFDGSRACVRRQAAACALSTLASCLSVAYP